MRHVTAKAAKVLFLTTLTAAALALSAAAAEESVGVGAVTGSSVRMRAEASTSSEILVTMDKGSVVALLSETPEDDWYHVAFAGNEGYVHANCGGVRIRTEASTESDVAATITEGTAFTVTGFQDGWYSVKCKYGTTGYIRSDLVDLIPSLDYGTTSASSSGSAIVALAQKWSLKVNVSVLKEPAISLLLASKDPSFLVPRMVIGHIMPAYATASGKVLLSALSEEKLEEVLDSIQLVSYTAKTIVDREELKECLREARKNGFATEVDELMVLRSCVAAPIQDRSGAYIGAISFSGSTETIAANMPALTNDIISTGKQISTELGYNYITI